MRALAGQRRGKAGVAQAARSAKRSATCATSGRHCRMYLGDGDIPIDNDQSEQIIRPLTVGRSNWLFLGHPRAAAGPLADVQRGQQCPSPSSGDRGLLGGCAAKTGRRRAEPSCRPRTGIALPARPSAGPLGRRPIPSPCAKSVSRRTRRSPTRSAGGVPEPACKPAPAQAAGLR